MSLLLRQYVIYCLLLLTSPFMDVTHGAYSSHHYNLIQVSRPTNSGQTSQQCPSQEDLILPCVCNASKNEVLCRGSFTDSGDRLRNAFLMFAQLVPMKLQHYNSIYINLRGLTTLEMGIFSGVRFSTVLLKSANLTLLHRDAFMGTGHYVHSLYIYETNVTNGIEDYQFFDAVRSLFNLRKLVINENKLVSIPERSAIHFDNSALFHVFVLNQSLSIRKSIGQFQQQHE